VSDDKFLNKHQKLARGDSPYPHETQDPEFGVKVSPKSKSFESVGNTEKRRENTYGPNDTVKGPGRY